MQSVERGHRLGRGSFRRRCTGGGGYSRPAATAWPDFRGRSHVLHERERVIAARPHVGFNPAGYGCCVGITEKLPSTFCDREKPHDTLVGLDDAPLPLVEMNAKGLGEATGHVENQGEARFFLL